MKSIEGCEEGLLSLFLTLQELDVIDQKNINLAVLRLEVEACIGLDGVDEVICENFTGNVSNALSWPILVYIITDGV